MNAAKIGQHDKEKEQKEKKKENELKVTAKCR